MDLNSLKREFGQVRLEISDIEERIENTLNNINIEEDRISQLGRDEINDINNSRSIQLNNYISESTNEISTRISDIRNAKENTISKLQSKLSSIKREDYFDKFKDTTDIVSRIHGLSEEKVIELLGEDYYNNLMHTLNKVDVKEVESIDELRRIIKNFTFTESAVKLFSKGFNIDVYKYFDLFFDKVKPVRATEDIESKYVVAYIIISLVVLTLVLRYIGAYVVIALFLVFLGLSYKNYMTIRYLLELKIIKSSGKLLEDDLNKDIDYMIKVDENKINEIGNRKIEELQSLYEKKVKEKEDIISKCKSDFVFDDSSIKDNYNKSKQRVLENINSNKASLEKDEESLEAAKLKKIDISNKIKEESIKLQGSYLGKNEIGSDTKMIEDFLMDVNVSGGLEFWKYRKGSSLFIWEDEEYFTKFLKLIVVQIASRMKPSMVSMKIIDFRYQNKSLIQLNGVSSDYLKIYTNTDEAYLADCKTMRDELDSRTVNMLREYDSIEDYNDFMLSISSVPEQYIIPIFVNLPYDELTKYPLDSVIRNGSTVGIIPFIFITEKDFSSGGKNLEALVDACDYIYRIEKKEPKIVHKSSIFEDK